MQTGGVLYPSYAKADIRRAGKLLAQELFWNDETAPAIREAFHVANSWREAHAFPMHSIRYQIIHAMRKDGIQGLSAARLKRMKAIRMKLVRRPDPLSTSSRTSAAAGSSCPGSPMSTH